MESTLIEIKSKLYAIDHIFKALSDGYNHAFIGMKFGSIEHIKELNYLIWDIHLSRDNEEYSEYMRKNKKEIYDAEQRIKENILWSLEHLKTFNKIPDVISNEYNFKFLENLIFEIIEDTCKAIANWNSLAFEYDIYEGERRVLVIKGNDRVLVLDVLNNIH